MGAVVFSSEVKEVTIEATVFRNDGTVEHLGVISQWNKDPKVNQEREQEIRQREAQRKSNDSI